MPHATPTVTCPLCGKPAYQALIQVECITPDCQNWDGRSPAPVESELDRFRRELAELGQWPGILAP